MKKEKKAELIKAAIPAIMVLSGMWNATAGVGGNMRPTAADVAEFRSQQTRQEQPAEAAFNQGEESEGHVYLTAGCNNCMADCTGTCEGDCGSGCSSSCEDGCKGKCSGGCSGGCTIVCGGSCYGGCRGSCTSSSWDNGSGRRGEDDWIDSIRRY